MAARPALDATLTAATQVAATSKSATSISATILSAPRIPRLQQGCLWWWLGGVVRPRGHLKMQPWLCRHRTRTWWL